MTPTAKRFKSFKARVNENTGLASSSSSRRSTSSDPGSPTSVRRAQSLQSERAPFLDGRGYPVNADDVGRWANEKAEQNGKMKDLIAELEA